MLFHVIFISLVLLSVVIAAPTDSKLQDDSQTPFILNRVLPKTNLPNQNMWIYDLKSLGKAIKSSDNQNSQSFYKILENLFSGSSQASYPMNSQNGVAFIPESRSFNGILDKEQAKHYMFSRNNFSTNLLNGQRYLAQSYANRPLCIYRTNGVLYVNCARIISQISNNSNNLVYCIDRMLETCGNAYDKPDFGPCRTK
ncbi:hypothetical protein BDF19DRAFT_431082 [Syncephalis fuscata]|nr:hypothetical protein BDF19DRAFT_431082 [Syncephalis fuscata]